MDSLDIICQSCDTNFLLEYDEDQNKLPKFCAFCGADLNLEEYEEEDDYILSELEEEDDSDI